MLVSGGKPQHFYKVEHKGKSFKIKATNPIRKDAQLLCENTSKLLGMEDVIVKSLGEWDRRHIEVGSRANAYMPGVRQRN